ncbi:hypothetical protein PVAG01_02146 [Phlyctema vagabunda]|uniref:Alcohol acetyltransferase n=1 Tax=Phlyctema vagabunda TaxID=108571 RepID=A0ABR4PPW6_9HELO
MIRSLGNLEKYSAARHNLGFYRSVACTARYIVDENAGVLATNIEAAVAQTIVKHPALRCGIINEEGKDPSFVRLDSIDLSQCIEYRTVLASTAAGYETGFVKILENQHDQLWPDLGRRPGWKVVIVQAEVSKTIDIIFSFHHSIADGVSGRVFHATLQGALLKNIKDESKLQDHVLQLPGSVDLVPSIEQLVDFKLSWSFFLREIWNSIKPVWLSPAQSLPWTGAPISLPSLKDYHSRILAISLPAEAVTAILAACRVEKATLTGLLHGLILASLSSRLPEASSFAASTPYSLRSISGSSPTDEICSQTSAMSTTYDSKTVSEIRSASLRSELLGEKMWDVARRFKSSITAELASLPMDSSIGLLSYVSDMHKYFVSKLGKAREGTFEVSNINSFNNSSKDGKWIIERLLFTQCGMVAGNAMSFNVASVIGGPLTISATWQDGIVEESLVEAVIQDLERNLLRISRGDAVV